MRVAALYDVHGNLPALEAVLADPRVSGVDAIVCGGDLCAGPMPAEALRLMQEQGALFVRGNADRELTREEATEFFEGQREARLRGA